MKFKSYPGSLGLIIPDDTLVLVKEYIGVAGKKETGGIIIGKYVDEQKAALVTEFTKAPNDSKFGFFWFLRGNHGFKELLLKYWQEGLYYLGEWHFHPFADPNPSFQDIKQMKKIALSEKYYCPEPILVIVGGNPEEFALKAFVVMGGNDGLIEFYRQ
jgi:integrative and conjugative element protein (TIGR02256 family)